MGKETARRTGDVQLAEAFIKARRAFVRVGRGYHPGRAFKAIPKIRAARDLAVGAERALLVRLLARELGESESEVDGMLRHWPRPARGGNIVEKKLAFFGETKR